MRQNVQALGLSCPTIKGKKSAGREQDDALEAFWYFDS
jgi:hypothetical protein